MQNLQLAVTPLIMVQFSKSQKISHEEIIYQIYTSDKIIQYTKSIGFLRSTLDLNDMPKMLYKNYII